MGRGSHSIDRMAPDYEDRQKTWGRKQKETKQPGEVCFSEGRKEDGSTVKKQLKKESQICMGKK